MQTEPRGAETGDRTQKRRPKEDKGLGIDTHPIEVRLRDLSTPVPDIDAADDPVPWADVLRKIHASPFMRRGDRRVAGLRAIDEMVDVSGHAPGKPFFVDAAGMLRSRSAAPADPESKAPMNEKEIDAFISGNVSAWLDERKVGGNGRAIYWFVAVQRTDRAFKKTCPDTGLPIYSHLTRVAYRQRDRLSDQDYATFRAFPDEVQQKLLAEAPHRPRSTRAAA